MGPIRRTIIRTSTTQATHNYEHWSSSLKCPTQFFPSHWKFPNVCLLVIALICSAILITYIYVYENIGPADANQNAAFMVFFIANSSLVIIALFAFGFIQINNNTGQKFNAKNGNSSSTESRRACFLINTAFFIILLVSLVAAMLFNLEPDARSAGKFLQWNVEKYGQPTKFFNYIQSQASCCGARNYHDYKKRDGSYHIPPSCCIENSPTENCTADLSFISKNGCYATSVQLMELEQTNLGAKGKTESSNSRETFYSIQNPELGLLLTILVRFPGTTTLLATISLLLFNYYQCHNDGQLTRQWSRIRARTKDSEHQPKSRNQPKPKTGMRRVITKKFQLAKLRGKRNRTRLRTFRNNNNDNNNNSNDENDSNSFNNSFLSSPRNNQSHIPLDSFITNTQNSK